MKSDSLIKNYSRQFTPHSKWGVTKMIENYLEWSDVFNEFIETTATTLFHIDELKSPNLSTTTKEFN